MIDFSFPLEELEYYLLILVRVSCFVFVAPFFSMNNTPRHVKIAISVFVAYLLYQGITPHIYLEYETLMEYAGLVIKEALTGLLIGLGAQLCMMIVSFAGSIVDMEIGFSMASQYDPMTRQQTTITGFLYQYTFLLIFLISGMHRYLLLALADTFQLIPVGGATILMQRMYDGFLDFLGNYMILGFRLCLPVFCVVMILNGILGVMAKVSPQMNMFAVGLQLKVLVGLSILFLTVGILPTAADFVFEQMKVVMVTFAEALGGSV